MSAIFGLVHLDGRPAAKRDLDPMGVALAAHGPDGSGVWVGEHVGLGQHLMCFTPEDHRERQPLIGAEGHHVLVADGRLDNRPELTHELGITSAEASTMPDSAFILRCYQKWGSDCCNRLIGDFVFALCDLHEGHVLIARSPLSNRALFYHVSPNVFAFASAPKGLFALPWVPREIDDEPLADYLVWAPREPGRSFYAGIQEVQAGQSIVVRREGFQLHQFWRPNLRRETRFSRDSDYVEAFNALFDRVIADHLRSLTPVGVTMSGGLDSSSVAATAARMLSSQGGRLATFTQVPRAGFELPPGGWQYADETPLVRAIGRKYQNMDLNFVRSDGCSVLGDIDQAFCANEAPFRSVWNRSWYEAILRQARHQNVRVLLTGIPGNSTISWAGAGLLAQLIRRGKWIRAFHEAQACSRENGGASAPRLLVWGATQLLPAPVWLAAGRLFRPDNPDFHTRPLWRTYSPIHPEFARLNRVGERARQQGHDFYFRTQYDSRAERCAILGFCDSSTQVIGGYEALFGVQSRNPAGDVRIFEFCLSLPEEQYQRDGVSRSLIRRAMRDRLPPEVVGNRRGGVQAADWFEGVTSGRSRMLDELARLQHSELAARVLDLKRIQGLLEQMPDLSTAALPVNLNYRSLVGSALMTGSFLRWLESSGMKGH